jgi:pimeloyl-ACP methyl ester carboxylesterase
MCRRNLYRHVMLLTLVGLVAAFAVQRTAATPPARSSVSVVWIPPGPQIDLKPCTLPGEVRAECGTLRVYEDRTLRSGRQIDLRIAVIRARGPNAMPDPIFYLAGGPGGVATEDARMVYTNFSRLRADRDIVLVDQRGVGGSHLLLCPEARSEAMAKLDDESFLADYIDTCLEQLDADIRFYTTAAAMDDLDEVRQALGYDQINLYGGSYGATAVQVYVRLHGEHVRSAVVAFGTLLDIPIFERLAGNSQRALNLLFDRCERDTTCQNAFPNVRAEFAAVRDRLAREAGKTTLTDPQTNEAVLMTRDMFANTVHDVLLSVSTAAKLPRLIHEAYLTGDFTALATSHAGGGPPFNLVMPMVIRCSEGWAAFSPEAIVRLGGQSYLTEAQVAAASGQVKVCQQLPDLSGAPTYGPASRSAVPVLFLNGEADPQDPPENVANAKDIWPNSLSVSFPAQGHNMSDGRCFPSLVASFIQQGSAQGLDTSCVEQLSLPPFDVSP